MGVDFVDKDIHDIFDYGVILTNDPTEIVILLSANRVRRCTFILDGEELDTSWERDRDRYICEFSGSDIPRNIDMDPGDSVSYYLDVDGAIFEGIIPVPYRPNGDWPQFDQSTDYSFTWDIGENPRVQVVELEIEDNDRSRELSWQISGERREFKIDEKNFAGYDANNIKVRMELYCIGYHLAGECIAYAFQVDRRLWYTQNSIPDPNDIEGISGRYDIKMKDLFRY
jgi:hypothetical protein